MPFENATSAWSAGVTLTTDEGWQNRGPHSVLVTAASSQPAADFDGGTLLRPGQADLFKSGATVYHCSLHSAGSRIWREAK